PRTTTCTLGNNDNLTIESSGSVIVTGVADALVVPIATTVTIQNNGTVRSNAVGIRIEGNVQSLANAGTVNTTGSYGIFIDFGTIGSITNSGQLSSVDTGLNNQGGVIGTITNASGGEIGGASNAYGIINGGDIETITNEEGATIRGNFDAIHSYVSD